MLAFKKNLLNSLCWGFKCCFGNTKSYLGVFQSKQQKTQINKGTIRQELSVRIAHRALLSLKAASRAPAGAWDHPDNHLSLEADPLSPDMRIMSVDMMVVASRPGQR